MKADLKLIDGGLPTGFAETTLAERLLDLGLSEDATYEEALEFYSYNQLGGWHGDGTPGFLEWLPEL